jgi:hypothetical protein
MTTLPVSGGSAARHAGTPIAEGSPAILLEKADNYTSAVTNCEATHTPSHKAHVSALSTVV